MTLCHAATPNPDAGSYLVCLIGRAWPQVALVLFVFLQWKTFLAPCSGAWEDSNHETGYKEGLSSHIVPWWRWKE